jgi:site-specific DNA-cytosine methylase
MFDFFEFFAGGGMVRAGLGTDWRCRFANDFDPKKSAVYRRNWGDGILKTAEGRSIRHLLAILGFDAGPDRRRTAASYHRS